MRRSSSKVWIIADILLKGGNYMDEEEKKQLINIIIIDKHELFRAGVRQLLKHDSGLEVIAEGETIHDAVQLAIKYEPNIILIDHKSITFDGLAEFAEVFKQSNQTKVIILSEQDDDNFMIDSLKMGATGYVLKEMNSETFISAIKEVNNGKYWFHPHVTHQIIKDYYHLMKGKVGNSNEEIGQLSKPLKLFTTREYDVLQLLAKGYSNKVIAEKLNITSFTVSSHVRNILKKSNANDRTHAVVIAVENGWVNIPRK